MPIVLLVASSDDHFREMIRENLLNVQNAKVAAEYPEVSANLYIRVLQDLERNPDAALVVDIANDPEGGLKVLEKVKQAAPDLYVVASNYGIEGDVVIAAVRSGANDYLVQPVKRLEFRDAVARLERAPRRVATGVSKLGKVYTFLGAKGGVGTTTLAVNFAAVLAQRKQNTVLLDLDWTANDAAMQLGAAPQYTLQEVGENLSRMDQALFEGFVTRDPLGFFLVGPPDSIEHRGSFTEAMLREFATFLVEKYESIVIDAGKDLGDDLVMGALQSSTVIFLVATQEFPTIRNAQRYIAALMRMGFSQDQLKVIVNQYQKRSNPNYATLEQIQQTLNQPIFYGVPPSPAVLGAINKARPFVSDRQAAGDLDRAFRAFVDKAAGRKAEAAKTA
ncbi:MAG: AAA family ATPase [Bryobacteraceae bacterium]